MFLFNLIHICFLGFFFRKQDEIPLQEMMLGVMMSSVKVGKSKKMCAVKKRKEKKKLETCSLDVENVEMEMCLEVRKERKTLEMNWTQFVNMRES